MTVDDLTYSFPRAVFERRPFDLLLFMLGVEVERAPWGRPFSPHAWNFDPECISSTGDYTKIIKRLCRIAGRADCLAEISDFVDLTTGQAWLKYRVGGIDRHWPVEVNNDWADVLTLSYVMDDIQEGESYFYSKENGQAMVLFYLDPARAAEINALSGNALKPFLSE